MINPGIVATTGTLKYGFAQALVAATAFLGLLVLLLLGNKRVLILVISSFVFIISWLRDVFMRLGGAKSPGTCVILYYHAVPARDQHRFQHQMDDLLRFAEPTVATRTAPLEPGRHYAVVTFDDAYQNILVNALPLLKVRRIPAAIFVVPEMLGRIPALSDTSTVSAQERQVMSIEDLRSLPGDSLTIGSHSLTHPLLTTLSTKEALHELTESRRVIEELVQRPVRLFCFPYGAYNEELFRLCQEAGYERVFTTVPEFAFSEPSEFVTGRVRVDPTDWCIEFRLKLLGAYRWLPLAWEMKRRILGRPFQVSPRSSVPLDT